MLRHGSWHVNGSAPEMSQTDAVEQHNRGHCIGRCLRSRRKEPLYPHSIHQWSEQAAEKRRVVARKAADAFDEFRAVRRLVAPADCFDPNDPSRPTFSPPRAGACGPQTMHLLSGAAAVL